MTSDTLLLPFEVKITCQECSEIFPKHLGDSVQEIFGDAKCLVELSSLKLQRDLTVSMLTYIASSMLALSSGVPCSLCGSNVRKVEVYLFNASPQAKSSCTLLSTSPSHVARPELSKIFKKICEDIDCFHRLGIGTL